MRSSQEEKEKRRLYKHTIKTKDNRVERIQPQRRRPSKPHVATAFMFPLKPELHTRLAASHTDRSWTRGLQSPSNSGYLQINEAVMPFAKPTHLAFFFSFSSFLVLPIWAGATVGPTNCRKIQSPNVILVYVWLFRERACFNVRVDGDGFNLGSSLASTLVRGQTDNSCARGESERTHAHCYCNA